MENRLIDALPKHRENVQPAWLDYNGHMNLSYYVLAFDHATDALLDKLDIGTAYREKTGGSVFVVEAHVNYMDEMLENAPILIQSRLLGVWPKRIRIFHEMFHGDTQKAVATNETMTIHVDLATRRSAPWPDDAFNRLQGMQKDHALYNVPPQAGRGIG